MFIDAKFRFRIIKILIGTIIFALAVIIPIENKFLELSVFLLAYLVLAYSVIKEAFFNIINGQVFDENLLMLVASVGAFFISKYPEAVAVMLFYQVGEFFQDYSVDKSRKSISKLMDIRPDYANLKQEDGSLIKVDPNKVMVGQIIVIKPGEKVPLDGKIVKGASSMDVKALTGESLPRELTRGDDVISGSVSINGLLEIKVEKIFGESTISKILDLVENASSKKARTENFITRFARYYTPAVVMAAVLIVIIPSTITGWENWKDWLYRALTFLVVSCPCALVISVPLSFFGGIGGASKKGILVKGSNYLEVLSSCDTIVFDKTGTLTKGVFKVENIHAEKITQDELLAITASAEEFSNHPISNSIKQEARNRNLELYKNIHTKEMAGYGIKSELLINDKKSVVHIGNSKLMSKLGIKHIESEYVGSIVYVEVDGVYIGSIILGDEIKEDAKRTILTLKKMGIKNTIMLTGDVKQIAIHIAEKIGIDEVYSGLLPHEKVEKLENLMKNRNKSSRIAFVGDGINDAPVLARADIGIAMGGLGSDAAIEAADIVLMDDRISGISTALKVSRKTLRIVKQNIIFALGVKGLVLLLAAFGMVSMWPAVFADVGVSIIAILNALRALKIK